MVVIYAESSQAYEMEVWQSWPNALVLKTRVPVKVPGVRIPPLPQLNCKWMPCASSTTRGNAYIEKMYGRNNESKYGGHSWRGLRESRLIVCVLWYLIFLRKLISLTL